VVDTEDFALRMPLILYPRKEVGVDLESGQPIDEELAQRCLNAHNAYKKHDPNYMLKDVYFVETVEELVEIVSGKKR
jgi:hypothetical protein